MNSARTRDLSLLVAFTGLSRFAFRSRYLYDIDSVNFALALRRFDPGSHQPHPPGYFLYVCLGRWADWIFHDANTALVAISIAFSCAAAGMIYLLAENWFGRAAALFAGLVFLVSPLAWFHGTVALTYIVEVFFSALTGYLCWRVETGSAGFVTPAAAVVGLAAGFRPSSLLFLGPLFLFSIRGCRGRRAAQGIGIAGLTILAWFIPMLRASGADNYFSSLRALWLTVPSKESVFNSPIVNSLARALVIAGIYVLCFGCAALLPVLTVRTREPGDRQKAIFILVWTTPGLLFFTFVYLKFVNSGYLLILTPPVCAWLGRWGADWLANTPGLRTAKILTIAGCAAVNTAIFVWAPFYCSYAAVRRFEAELTSIAAVLPELAPAGSSIIVGLDSHFLGYRHAGYYLPDYLTVQFPEVRLAGGIRVFAMRDQDTRVTAHLATGSIRNFVLFPLPAADPDYRDYSAVVRGRLPAEDLRVISRSGHEFAMGPIEDLHFLFPDLNLEESSPANKR